MEVVGKPRLTSHHNDVVSSGIQDESTNKVNLLRRSLFLRLSLPIFVLMAVASVCIVFILPRMIEQNAISNAVTAAEKTVNQFKVLRKYYTDNVVKKVIVESDFKASFEHKDVEMTIPLPATVIHDLSILLKDQGTIIKLYSAFPFPNRSERVLDEFGKLAWESLQSTPDQKIVETSVVNEHKVVRVAIADRMVSDSCVACHNSHPLTPKTGWKLGDVRGVLEVTTDIEPQIANGIAMSYKILAIFGVLVLVVIILVLMQAWRATYRLTSILATVREIGTGNLELTLPTDRSDEIGALERGINSMTKSLRKTTTSIDRLNEEIADRKRAEEKIVKLSQAVESSSSMVIITDLEGIIEYVNPKFTEVTGYTREEVMEKNINILNSEGTSEDAYIDLWDTVQSDGIWKGEFNNRKKDGALYRDRASIAGIRNAEGIITHYVSIQEDVTQEYELSKKLSFQASHDALTGLINRREFEHRAERLLSTHQQDETEHALCFMDLDQFKIVNDTCGHIAGDELLRQIAMILQQEVRKRDTLARLGGDEFAVLMEHCSLDQANRLASSLLMAVQDYQFSWEEHSFNVGVSIGVVAITEITPNLTELLKQADAACYMAKDLGRNRIHVFHTEDKELVHRHGQMQWVERIYQALNENRFCLYAQAIEPLGNSTDKHYELLIRMKDKNGKLILPGAFLPAAERYNLIGKLDRWVIGKTFDLLTENPAFVEQINFISINLSGESLADDNILNFIITQLDKTSIDGSKICFEITETAAISNLSFATKFISTLKDLGCRFALDDFGSGLSSFGYLKNLPVDYLKIDGMFVKDIVEDPIDRAMVKSINEIGKVMGMKTIAEFVENDVIKDMLKEINVDFAQGYGVGMPLDFVELLARPITSSLYYR